jgi:hypothetical protein
VRPHRPRALRAFAPALVLVLATAACDSLLRTAPLAGEAPPGWEVVTVVDFGGIATASLALPPSFHATDHPPAGVDNRADALTRDGLTLQFEGPRNPDSQLRPGEDLHGILERRLDSDGKGEPTYTNIELPAGPAVRVDRVDQRGEGTFRIVCYAIRMPVGTASLLFDGQLAAYAGHELEIAQIAMRIAVP